MKKSNFFPREVPWTRLLRMGQIPTSHLHPAWRYSIVLFFSLTVCFWKWRHVHLFWKMKTASPHSIFCLTNYNICRTKFFLSFKFHMPRVFIAPLKNLATKFQGGVRLEHHRKRARTSARYLQSNKSASVSMHLQHPCSTIDNATDVIMHRERDLFVALEVWIKCK